MRILAALSVFVLSACLPSQSPDEAFFETMLSLCGETFSGQVVSNQEVDAAWRAEILQVGPVSCADDVIRMPLAVGNDSSRTWVLSRTDAGLLFRHEHVEPDGSPSPVTEYGGLASAGGTATRQDFPADVSTQTNFRENGLTASLPNVWTLNLESGVLGYALARPATETDPARDFRAEFDLKNRSN